MLLNQFFIKEDFCFSSLKLVGAVLLDVNYSVFRHWGIKLNSLEIKHARNIVNFCTQALYGYEFWFLYWKMDYVHQLLFFFLQCWVQAQENQNRRHQESKEKETRGRRGNMKDKFISMIKKSKADNLVLNYVEQGESDSRVRRQVPVWEKAAYGRSPPMVQVNLSEP